MKLYIFFIAIVGSSSCTSLETEILTEEIKAATTLTEEEKQVNITQDPLFLADCNKINTITIRPKSKTIKCHPMRDRALQKTLKKLDVSKKMINWLSIGWQIKTKIRAVKEGGNTAFIGNIPSLTHMNVLAEIYRCP